MSAQAILDDLHRRGVSFSVNGDKLRTRGPVGVVTEADLSALRKVKAEAMAIIRDEVADRIEERAAIIQFQTRAGMTPDGQVSDALLIQLSKAKSLSR